MITAVALQEIATSHTDRLRLEPQSLEHLDGLWSSLAYSEMMRLTETHATFTQKAIHDHLARLPGRQDRADSAIVRALDEHYSAR